MNGDDSAQELVVRVRVVDEASAGFQAAMAAADATVARLSGGNRALADSAAAVGRSATDSAKAVAAGMNAAGESIHAATDAAMKNIDQLKARFRDLGQDTSAGLAASKSSIAELDEQLRGVVRSMQALRDDSRAGLISPQARQAVLERMTPQILAGESRENLQSRYVSGDEAGIVRYRALQVLEREQADAAKAVAAAEREATASVVASVDERVAALRAGVKAAQISTEEEAAALRELGSVYENNADAMSRINRAQLVNQQAFTREEMGRLKEREQLYREHGHAISEALLNTAYSVPGPIGNAGVNLGYLAASGPQALAIGGTALAALGAGAAAASLADVAGRDQEAMARLGQAVKDQGGDWTALASQVDAWATVQAKTTQYSRDQTIPALKEFVTAGMSVKDALEVTRVAEDVSAASGKPLADVTNALASAYLGNSRGLNELHILTRDAIKDGEAFGEILGKLEDATKGQATANDTYVEKLGHALSATKSLAEGIGSGLIPSFSDATDAYTKFVGAIDGKAIGTALRTEISAVKDLAGAFGDLFGAASPALDTIRQIAAFKLEDTVQGLHDWATMIRAANAFAAGGATLLGPNPVGWHPFGTQVLGSQLGPASAPVNQIYGPLISQYAQLNGLDPSIVAPLFAREDWSGNPNIVSKAGAIGLGQLMPGTALSLGVTDPRNPQQNIGAAIQYFAQQLHDFGGNLAEAYAAYNAGPGAVRAAGGDLTKLPKETQDYVAYMMANQNAGPTTAMLHGIRGAGTPAGAATSELDALSIKYGAEERAGIESWRQDYENALAAIRDDQTKTFAERVAAQSKWHELTTQDAAEQKRAGEDAARASEAATKMAIAQEQDRQREGRETLTQEIANLEVLKSARERSNDPNAAKDVEAIQRRIDTLQGQLRNDALKLAHDVDEAFKRALEHQISLYRTGHEELSTFLRNVSAMENSAGVTTDQRDRAAGAIYRAQAAADAADKSAKAEDERHKDLGAAGSEQAADAIEKVRARYDELNEAINTSGADAVTKARELIAAAQDEIEALKAVAAQYQDTYQDDAGEALKKFQDAEDALQKTVIDDTLKMGEAQRQELQKQADDWRKFADTASDHLASIFEGGPKSLRETMKSALAGVEHDLIRSSIGNLLFPGAASPFNPMADFQKAFFGTTAPSGAASNPFGVSNELVTDAFTKLKASPTGKMDDPLYIAYTPTTLQQTTGSTTGVAPGSPTAIASSDAAPALLSSAASNAGVNAGPATAKAIVGGGLGTAAGVGMGDGSSAPSWITGALGLAAGFAGGGGNGGQINVPYAQTMANLYGSEGTGGSTVFGDPAVSRAFGTSYGYAGVQNLLAMGPQAFMAATGLSYGQYQNYVGMFNGQPVTQQNYQNYQAAIDTIMGGLSITGAGLPFEAYSLSRSGSNYASGTMNAAGLFYPITTKSSGGPGLPTIAGGSGFVNANTLPIGSPGYTGSVLTPGGTGASGLLSILELIALLEGYGGSGASSSGALGGLGGALSFLGGGGGGYNSVLPTNDPEFAAAAALNPNYLAAALGPNYVAPSTSPTGVLGYLGTFLGGGAGTTGTSGLASLLRGGAGGLGGLGNVPGLSNLLNGNGNVLGSGLFGSTFTGLGLLSGIGSSLGLGEVLTSLLGGNSTNSAIGGALGIGSSLLMSSLAGFGLALGPVGIGIGVLGSVLGGLFGPHWGPPSNYPDRSDTTRYGTIIADLFGTSNPNGQSFYEDPAIKNLFNGGTGIAGIGRLLAAGQQGFMSETGLSAAQYQLYLQMFGAGATTLDFPTSNVGILEGTGQGAQGTYTYLQYGQALQNIISGLQATGAVGPYNSYTFSKTYPSYTGASSSGSSAGLGNGPAGTSSATGNGSANGGTASLDLRGSIFVGSNNASAQQLADLVNRLLSRQAGGSLPTALVSPYRAPVI